MTCTIVIYVWTILNCFHLSLKPILVESSPYTAGRVTKMTCHTRGTPFAISVMNAIWTMTSFMPICARTTFGVTFARVMESRTISVTILFYVNISRKNTSSVRRAPVEMRNSHQCFGPR